MMSYSDLKARMGQPMPRGAPAAKPRQGSRGENQYDRGKGEAVVRLDAVDVAAGKLNGKPGQYAPAVNPMP